LLSYELCKSRSWLYRTASLMRVRCGLQALLGISSLPLWALYCLAHVVSFLDYDSLTICRSLIIPSFVVMACLHLKYKDIIIIISRFICCFQCILQNPGCLTDHKLACPGLFLSLALTSPFSYALIYRVIGGCVFMVS
jgi:hypothetical protein